MTIAEVDAGTRAETVGSLLRTAEVVQTVRSKTPDQQLLDNAVLAAIRLQEEVGLDISTDGELRRAGWAETPRYLDCFEPDTSLRGLQWHGGDASTAASAPSGYDVVVRRVSQAQRRGDQIAQYAFLAEHAAGRTKYTIAAPSYHRRNWSPERSTAVYANADEYLYEIRDYVRELVERLIALGCDYIQLDGPNYGTMCDPATRPRMEAEGRDYDAELAFDIALDNSLFDGVSGVTRALHICRGNASGGRWHSTGGYGAISGVLFPQLDFDRLLLEYDSERAGDFGPLTDMRPGVIAVLGLLTTKSGVLEDEKVIIERLEEAAGVKPLAELALSTQCGFASVAEGNPVTPDEQRAKLAMIAAISHQTWPAR